MTSHFTRRDALDSAITGHGSAPVADFTGTTPLRTASGYDAALFDAFNAGVQRAAREDWRFVSRHEDATP